MDEREFVAGSRGVVEKVWVWEIKFNFLPFSSPRCVGIVFCGVFSCFDGVFGVGLGSTQIKTDRITLFEGCV